MSIIRIVFVLAVAFFGWWSLRGEWPAVLSAFGQVVVYQWLISIGLVLAGLTCTAIVWTRVLAGYGHRLPIRAGFSVFFVGQLGKYIPGSVWSLAAQGQMARQFAVPVRTTVATGLIFLYWNIATATLISAVLTLTGQLSIDFSPWISISAALVAAAAIAPMTVRSLANKLAGTNQPLHTRWRDSVLLTLLMLVTWILYGLAMVEVGPEGTGIGGSDLTVGTAIAAFTLAYVLGVLVPFAPAGFGIREATVAFLLTPTLGLTSAAAVALLTRAIHTIADFGLAAGAWIVNKAAHSNSAQRS